MPDIADDRAAYREAMSRAEAASGIERDADGNETNGIESIVRGETPVATPELQEAVPVQASDQPLDTEPAVAETVVETPAVVDTSEQQETLFAGKYKSLEDLEKAHVELQQKLGDPNRLDLENRRLQEKLDELGAKIDAQVQPAVTPQEGQLAPVTQWDIENDPAEATVRAFEIARRNNVENDPTLSRAYETWKEYDGTAAIQWFSDLRFADQERKFNAKLAETQKALDEKTAPLAQQQEEQAQTLAWAQAFDTAKLGRPDFIENAERLLSEVAPLHPSFLANLQSADPKVKADALIALYAIDKIGNPEAVALELGEKAKEAAEEAATALAAGAVVSGQLTAGQTAVKKSDEELEAAAYVSRMGSKPSLSRGWTGRS